MVNWLRWFLIVPVVVVAWVCVVFVGMISYEYLDWALCPKGGFVDDCGCGCNNPGFSGRSVIVDLILPFFAGLSAIVVVLSAVAVAPSRKRYVALSVTAVGIPLSLILGDGVSAYSVAAIAGGFITTMVIFVCGYAVPKRLFNINEPSGDSK
ncbi:MAG: hypothetical protein AB7E15_15650 [Azospira sp.]